MSEESQKQEWVSVLGVTAVVYNPLIRIHLTREIWCANNVVTIGIASGSAFVLKAEPEREDG